MKTLDLDTQGAIRDRNSVVVRDFVLITVKDGEGAPVNFGFTSYGEDVTLNIVDGFTGSVVGRTYYGDSAPIVRIDPIPAKIGLEVDTVRIALNALHPAVQTMFRGHDCRNAPVQVHRAYLSRDSMLPVAYPRCRRLGWINGAPEEIPGAGSDGATISLEIVSVTRELTRTNGAKRSDAVQRLRDGDRFRRYSGTAHRWPIWWGEAKAPTRRNNKGRRQ